MKALVTARAVSAGRKFEVQSLDLVDGFDVTDAAAWEQVGPVDLACLNAAS